MLRNHLLFATRLFLKEGIYSILNILGLSLGITIGIVLFLYLQMELTYDQHYTKHKQIYRYTNRLIADGVDINTARSARELAPILKDELPEVLDYVRFIQLPETLVEIRNEFGSAQHFYEDKVWITDSSMFSVFDHDFYEGDPKTCLSGTGKVVITSSIARKYFGDQKALGKFLSFSKNDFREITAVISDLPDNSHLKYSILLSHIPDRNGLKEGDATRRSEGFWNPGAYTYLLMPPDYDEQNFHSKFPEIFDKTFKLFGKRINGRVEPDLQPIADIHFNSRLSRDETVGNKNYVYTLAAIGLFIIILACINYMNMATARSVTRTSEIGIRKVLGLSRLSLFRNIVLESLLLSLASMLLAIIFSFVILELTSLKSLIGKDLSLNLWENPLLIFGVLGITFVVGILSSLYPALYIPAVPAVDALKGIIIGNRSAIALRRVLITFQFVISLFVIICMVIMNGQITYMQDTEIGFEKDNVILMDIRDTTAINHMDAIMLELLANPKIEQATTAYGTPGINFGNFAMWVERDSTMVQQVIDVLWVGEGYVETMGMELMEGRDFRDDFEHDYQNAVLVNQTAARELGWGENAIGKKVRTFRGKRDKQVVGIVKDFNYESLHNKINPLFIIVTRNNGGRIHIRVKNDSLLTTIDYIREIWTKYSKTHPFEYTFLDQHVIKQYDKDKALYTLISILSYVCIFISLLGLIGLSVFATGRRFKEISIRKLLGAEVSNIIVLFSKDYLILIVIACLISSPIAYYIASKWLTGFAYRTDINLFHFVLPGILLLTLSLAAVIIQLSKSARVNPVDGLRHE